MFLYTGLEKKSNIMVTVKLPLQIHKNTIHKNYLFLVFL